MGNPDESLHTDPDNLAAPSACDHAWNDSFGQGGPDQEIDLHDTLIHRGICRTIHERRRLIAPPLLILG